MADGSIPAEVRELARLRADARRARDWSEADRLRTAIEEAGWTIVDDGLRYRLKPFHPPDMAGADGVRYGRSDNVPSVLDEGPTTPLTALLVIASDPDDGRRCVRSIARHAPEGTSIVVVVDGLEVDLASLDGSHEVVRTSTPLGHAAALNCGLRRAVGAVVTVIDPSVELTGDAFTPLLRALEEPTVAIAGPFGIVSEDLRRFHEGGAGEVDAIEGYLLAFRRHDYVRRGPFDERFRFYRNLDIWWSLVLRDEGPGRVPRRALAVDGLPLVRHEHRGWTALPEAERDRLSRRNFYRVLDRFRDRRDLLVEGR